MFDHLFPLFGSFLIPTASAQGYTYIRDIIGAVGIGMPTLGQGAGAYVNLAEIIISQLRPLLFILGTLLITILGFRMVIGQEDESIDKAKTTIISVISGIMIAFLIEPFIGAFYGAYGESITAPAMGVSILSAQVEGILDWILTLAGIIAVTMIIVSGLKAVANPLNEEGLSNLRQTIISVAAGMLVLIFRVAITIGFGATGNPNPNIIIEAIVTILTFLLAFIGLAAVVVLIYAGILMLLNFGNDEAISKAKGIIQRAIIGIIIILVSIGIVQFVIGAIV